MRSRAPARPDAPGRYGGMWLALALVMGSETIFASVVPTALTGRIEGGDLVIGVVVGAALGLGLLAVPFSIRLVRARGGAAVLQWCGVVMTTAGPACVLGAWAPAAGVLVAALVYGVGRAVAAFVLLCEVGRLGAESRGQGYNSAAQRFGSAAGGCVAGWAIAGGREGVAVAVLAAAAVAVVVLARTGRAGTRATVAAPDRTVGTADVDATWQSARRMVARDRRVRSSCLLNVSVWTGLFMGNTLLPVALLRIGLAREDVGDRVLMVLVVRDLAAVLIGVVMWPLLSRLPVAALVLGVGAANAVAGVVMVGWHFETAALLVAAVLAGLATSVGISCANVIATSGPALSLEERLAASQALAAVPVTLLAVAMVASLGPVGGTGAVLGGAGVAALVATVAAWSAQRGASGRAQASEESAETATQI